MPSPYYMDEFYWHHLFHLILTIAVLSLFTDEENRGSGKEVTCQHVSARKAKVCCFTVAV